MFNGTQLNLSDHDMKANDPFVHSFSCTVLMRIGKKNWSM